MVSYVSFLFPLFPFWHPKKKSQHRKPETKVAYFIYKSQKGDYCNFDRKSGVIGVNIERVIPNKPEPVMTLPRGR